MKRFLVTASVVVVLVVLAFAFSPRPRAQNRKHLNLRVAFTQKGAPVQIKSLTHTLKFYYGSAVVQNVSQQTIRSITFGVLLHEAGPASLQPILASSREIATNIDPGESRSVDVEDAAPRLIRQKAADLKSNVVVVEFGILAVQFDDGSIWQYDWQSEGAFNTQNVSGAKQESLRTVKNCNALGSLLDKLPAIGAVLRRTHIRVVWSKSLSTAPTTWTPAL